MISTCARFPDGRLSLTSRHRVLVVEDHKPFRGVLCQLLQNRPDVLIVGEAEDGLDAVRQAEAQRPDVVMLDIGLPKLGGLDVAGRIRAAVPDAKVMFVTNEPSLEVVEFAFRRGAHGYVYKPRAERDVLPVFDAIVRGGRFVSGGLERIALGDSLSSHCHQVLFWSSDTVLVEAFSRFVTRALDDGKVVIVVMTEVHERDLRRCLTASDVNLAVALHEKRYIPVNIGDVLAEVMVDGWPDSTRFLNAAAEMVAAAGRATASNAGIAAVGECSATVWAQGLVEAAMHFEHLWDEFAKSCPMDVLCAFPLAVREESLRAVRSLCAEHTAVEIS
jgi:DNA-binding NarL/FixJ family response regulator